QEAVPLLRSAEPAFAPEKDRKPDANRQTTGPKDRIGVSPTELGDILEVHTVNTGEEGDRNEKTGHDCQHFHDFVHSVADRGLVEIGQTGGGIAVSFQKIDQLDNVILDVAIISLQLRINKARLVVIKMIDQFPYRPEHPSLEREIALHRKQLLL